MHSEEIEIRSDNNLSSKITENKLSLGTYENTICEIYANQGRIVLTERKMKHEDVGFLFWVGESQLCVEWTAKQYWFWLKKGRKTVSKCTLKGEDLNQDKFIKRGNHVYVSVSGSHELYRVSIKDDSLNVKLLGRTNSTVTKLVEVGNKVLAGAFGLVYCFTQGRQDHFCKMDGEVSGIWQEGDLVWSVDRTGLVQAISLSNGKRLKYTRLGSEGTYYFSNGSIVGWRKNDIQVFKKDGSRLKKIASPVKQVFIIENNPIFAVLSYENQTFVWKHSSFSLKQYKTSEIPWFYLY